jgi:UDP-N-acetylmuramyl tripeptide synthase
VSESDPRPVLDLLAAAEPTTPRPLAGLVERLRLAGRLRGGDVADDGLERVLVTGIAYDSRRVRPGTVFVAVPGAHADGHQFIDAAIAAGAVAVVAERPAP